MEPEKAVGGEGVGEPLWAEQYGVKYAPGSPHLQREEIPNEGLPDRFANSYRIVCRGCGGATGIRTTLALAPKAQGLALEFIQRHLACGERYAEGSREQPTPERTTHITLEEVSG